MRIFKVLVTRGQFNKLFRISDNYEESDWWEALSDITEHPPEWLKDTLKSFLERDCTRSQFNKTLEDLVAHLKRKRDSYNGLIFVYGSQKESGEFSEVSI